MNSLRIYITLVITLIPGIVLSCPLCNSITAGQVRYGIEKTASDPVVLLALTSPFILLGFWIFYLNKDWSKTFSRSLNEK